MKVTLIAVTSVNGKITQDESPDIYSWTSEEDKAHFFSMIQSHQVIVMGAKTYQAAKPVMKLQPGKLRIVMTHHPEQYIAETVTGQLEFSRKTPKEMLQNLKANNIQSVLIAGGSEINTLFLTAGCVDEIQLTIEPAIFGAGQTLFKALTQDSGLKLLTCQKLNQQGTLLLKYAVLSDRV